MRAVLASLFLSAFAFAGEDEALVGRLGDDSWSVREEAMLACLAKPALRPLLEIAVAGNDAEAAWRARWVLGCFDWGIDAEMAKRAGNPFENFEALADEELSSGLQLVMRDTRPQRLGVLLQAVRRFREGAARTEAIADLRSEVAGDKEWAAARLASADAQERLGAALILAWRGDKRGADEMKASLAAGSPVFDRQTLVEALIAIGDPAGMQSLLDAVRAAVQKKIPPDVEDLKKLSTAPIGTAEVEDTLFAALESDYGGAPGAGQVQDAALDGLARCGGAKAATRLAAWWEANPDAHAGALFVAAALADPAALKDLAARAESKLGGEKATVDQLFTVAALHRLAGDADARKKTVERMAAMDDVPGAFERVAEVALGFLETGDAGSALEYLDKALKKGASPVGPLALLADEAAKATGTKLEKWRVAPNYNNDAWYIVTKPERLSPPGLAVRMAERTVARDPEPAYRGTLGAAYFRAARYEDAVKTLVQNLEVPYEGKEEDLSFLVMSYKRLGKVEEAHDVEAKCRTWESQSGKPNPMGPEMERVLREP